MGLYLELHELSGEPCPKYMHTGAAHIMNCVGFAGNQDMKVTPHAYDTLASR